ncbi:MAG: prepilin-type N-terminal cleavage/methylation domain-containing protein [Planctomycetes bacterium]|nr:prepilin-type N-terminal cleavage/methylation domain-containing protein [Planctomycetota bacterium]
MSCAARTSRTAFTLMEVIVVICILAIMAAMTIPRLLGQNRRAVQVAADEVADLLTMYAQREMLSQKPVGVWHDAERNWIMLMILELDPDRPDEPADWRLDPHVAPVKLPANIPAANVSARENGEPVDFQLWPIDTAPGKQRPSIEIALLAVDGTVRRLVLPSYAIAPHQLENFGDSANVRSPIDLDEAGRHQEDW